MTLLTRAGATWRRSAFWAIGVLGLLALGFVGGTRLSRQEEVRPSLLDQTDALEARLRQVPGGIVSLRMPQAIVVPGVSAAEIDRLNGEDWSGDDGRLGRPRSAYAAQELRDHLQSAGLGVTIEDESPQAFRLVLWDAESAARARRVGTPL